jgi:PAS domain S-box-containing protein
MSKQARQVDIRDFINDFSLTTIQGRIFLLALLSLFLIFTFSLIIFIQNQETYRISQNVEHLEIPLALAASSLSSGLDKVTASQEGYIMSGEEIFRKERVETWEKEIMVALEIMKQLSQESNSSADRQKVKEINELLVDFKKAQDDIDKYFLENRRAFNYEGISTDSISSVAIELLAQYNQDRRTQKQMVEMLGNEATPIRQKIANSIKPLIENQQNLLKKEVNFIQENIGRTNWSIVVIGFLSIILLGGISISLIRTVRQSISKPVIMLNRLAHGNLDTEEIATKDELNAVIQAGLQLTDNLQKASEFALSIGDGNFEKPFQPASEKDVLGNALLQMREQLQLVATENKKRTWVVEGMAKLVEIIQSEHHSFGQVADEVIKLLTNYMKVNQGGIFVINNDNPDEMYLEMLACYAYHRKKFLEKKIPIKNKFAEGLIGQAYMEKQTIYLTELPSDYLYVTSGLGKANPAYLLVVPLKLNDKVEGIIELASFKAFEKHEIEFVEQVGETIAATIITTKANAKTANLLQETRQQDAILREREATLDALINNNDDAIVVIDSEFRVILFNTTYQEIIEKRGLQVYIGVNLLDIVPTTHKEERIAAYRKGLNGEKFVMESIVQANDNTLYYETSYNPIRDESGKVMGVSIFARDITERKLTENQLIRAIEEERNRAHIQVESQRKILEQSVLLFKEKEKKLLEKIMVLEKEMEEMKVV